MPTPISYCAGAAIATAAFAIVYNDRHAAQQRETHLKRLLDYQTDGVVVLRGLLAKQLANLPNEDFTHAVDEAMLAFIRFTLKDMGCSPDEPGTSLSLRSLVECREQLVALQGEDETPYINSVQYIHVHRHSKAIRAIAESSALGQVAAELLRVDAVRLYQTAAFIKAPAVVAAASTPVDRLASTSSATAWHADLNQVPLDTNHFGTFWCPLSDVDRSHSLLAFARGSQRDVSVRHWFRESSGLLRNETELDRSRRNATDFLIGRHGLPVDFSPMRMGDCTFHSGWMLHSAPPNLSGQTRRALAFSFVDAEAKLVANNSRGLAMEDKISWSGWVDAVYEQGATLEHPLLPVVGGRQNRDPRRSEGATGKSSHEYSIIERFEHPGYLP